MTSVWCDFRKKKKKAVNVAHHLNSIHHLFIFSIIKNSLNHKLSLCYSNLPQFKRFLPHPWPHIDNILAPWLVRTQPREGRRGCRRCVHMGSEPNRRIHLDSRAVRHRRCKTAAACPRAGTEIQQMQLKNWLNLADCKGSNI